MKPIELNDLISHVRSELLIPSAAKTASEAVPVLFVEEVELEVSVIITNSQSGDGKINLQVVEIGSGINLQNETMHKIKIRMSPLLSKEKFISDLEKDERLSKKIEDSSRRSLLKEDGILGED